MPLLSLSRVDFDYGREALLRDVTLDLEPGEKVALVGVNGSGKSTLLQLIAGTLAPDKGERHLARRARVVTLPQETSAEGDGTLLAWVKSAHEVEIVAHAIEAFHRRLETGDCGDRRLNADIIGASGAAADADAVTMTDPAVVGGAARHGQIEVRALELFHRRCGIRGQPGVQHFKDAVFQYARFENAAVEENRGRVDKRL